MPDDYTPQTYDYSDERQRYEHARQIFLGFCTDLIDADERGFAGGARSRLVSRIQMALAQAHAQGRNSNQ